MEKTVTLVILPGLDGTEVLFRPFLALLPGSVRPVVVTYPPTGPNGYADLLRIVRGKVTEFPGDYFVLASSFSGPIAVMLAAAEPDRLRGMILVATFLRAPARHLPVLGFAARGPVIWAIRAARRLPIWMRLRRDDPLRRAKAEIWRRVPAHCLAKRIRAVLRVDVRELLVGCRQPVWCIAFADDRVVPPANAEEILLHGSSARLTVLPGDHFAVWKNPLPLKREVVRFLREGAHP